ncbi:MAG: DUF1330 domain-containing protein [Gammaproteobacteria bacterium]|nr:DUF1330 domain-containing protein [Gammaproteobacteria bacterium]
MSAFIIVDTKIKDAEAYEEYKSLARPIVEKFGGAYRTRGGDIEILESDLWSPTRIVIVEFPDLESAKQFANSEEYAPVQAIRHANAECTLIIVDGM